MAYARPDAWLSASAIGTDDVSDWSVITIKHL